MKRLTFFKETELNEFLKHNTWWANGKNISVDHLHVTCAESPRFYENLCGIYVTDPAFVWMALWMATTSRVTLRKRQLCYIRPDIAHNDYIGNLEISSQAPLEACFHAEAFLYLFDPNKYAGEIIDIKNISSDQKISHLRNQHNFLPGVFERKGKAHDTFLHQTNNPIVVLIDEWQIALVNIERIIPDIEIRISEELIKQLQKRVTRTDRTIGDDYIQNRREHSL